MQNWKNTVRRSRDELVSSLGSGTPLPVVVADKDERVHEIARKALQGLEVAGSPIEVRTAISREEVRPLLEGAGLLLLDAELDALDVLGHLREDRQDVLARVLVRVGPELPPWLDEAFVERFAVDGFLDEDDLESPLRLHVVVRSALRAHTHAATLQRQVEGLGQIAEALSGAKQRAALAPLLRPLVEDIAKNCWTDDYSCVPFLDEIDQKEPIVVSGGKLEGLEVARALVAEARPHLEGTGPISLADARTAFRLVDTKTRTATGILVVGTPGPVPSRVKTLVQSLGHRLSIARRNIELEGKLAAEKEAAQEIYNDRMGMLGRMAASVAHELNTPLGIAMHASSLINEYASQLKDSGVSGDLVNDLNEAVALVTRNVEAAASLVKSFKGMAVEAAQDNVEPFDPATVVADAVNSLAHVLRPKQQQVKLETDGAPVQLTNNPGKLAQVVNNLVLNACKHAYEEGPGTIVVRHRSQGGQFLLEIEDQGKGMEDKVARRVFEPFMTTAKGRGGSGLGMSIVHQIVTGSYKGTIVVESELGKGTRFKIALPIA